MEPKDYVLAAGVVVTLVLGIWNAVVNHRTSQRTMFINTVTTQRIKWIEQLRQDISTFSGLTYHWCFTDVAGKPEESEMLKEIDRLRHVIRLRLNPSEEPDKTIEQLIGQIPRLTGSDQQQQLVEALEELTRTTQRLLKQEWEKVKSESKQGDLSVRA